MSPRIEWQRIMFYVRLGLAMVLLSALFLMVDFHKIGDSLATVQLPFIIAAFFVMTGNYILKTYRWAAMLWIPRPDISFGEILRFNFLSMFLGSFLPTSLSPDIVRIYYVAQRVTNPAPAISSILADRIVGNLALAVVALATFLALGRTGLFPMGSLLSYGVGAFVALSLAIPLVFASRRAMTRIRSLLGRFAGGRFRKGLEEIGAHWGLYRSRSGLVGVALMVAFMNLAIVSLEFYLIARGFSAPVGIGYFFIFIPLVICLASIPVSFGGLGVVEAGLVFLFSRAGMPVEMCLSMALVFRGLQVLLLVPGALIYLTDGLALKQLQKS